MGRISAWVIAGVVVLCGLLSVLILFAPAYLNGDQIKAGIVKRFAHSFGGEADYRDITLGLLPRPHFIFHQATILVPKKIQAKILKVAVYPQLRPILAGRLRLARILVQQPVIEIYSATPPSQKGPGLHHLPLDDRLKPIFGMLVRAEPHMAGMSGVIKDGSLAFHAPKIGDIQLFSLNAIFKAGPSTVNLALRCQADFVDVIKLDLNLHPDNFRTDGSLSLAGIDIHSMASRKLLGGLPVKSALPADMDIRFKTAAENRLVLDLDGTFPRFGISTENKIVALTQAKVDLEVQHTPDSLRVLLKRLKLDHPDLTLSGEWMSGSTKSGIRLNLDGGSADLENLRAVALAVAGKYPVTRKICEIVTAGNLETVSIKMSGDTVKDMGKWDNIIVRGRLSDGGISIPGYGLILQSAGGAVEVSGGILKGNNLQARLGNSTARNGSLTLGLKDKDTPLRIAMQLDADLSQIQEILTPFISHAKTRDELKQIKNAQGTATAFISIAADPATPADFQIQVSASEIDLRCDYRHLPYPLFLNRGDITIGTSGLTVKNLDGNLGKSTFSNISGELNWNKGPFLTARSDHADLAAEELFAWLTSYPRFKDSPGLPSGMNGRVTVLSSNFSGDLFEPENWTFSVDGTVNHLLIGTAKLPENVTLVQGKFRVDPYRLQIQNLQVRYLDSSARFTGSLAAYLDGFPDIDLTFYGTGGSRTLAWISEPQTLPKGIVLRTPLFFSEMRVVSGKTEGTTIAGSLTVADGPDITLEAHLDGDRFYLKTLWVKDEESDAFFSLLTDPDQVTLVFTGKLTQGTLDRAFTGYRFPAGWITGDIEIYIVKNEPTASTAQGSIRARDINLPGTLGGPLKIDHLDVTAHANRITIGSSRFFLDKNPILLEGDIYFSNDALDIDFYVTTGHIDWEILADQLKNLESRTLHRVSENKSRISLNSRIHVVADSFSYDAYTFKPLKADIALNPGHTDINITEAGMCGIQFPGEILTANGKTHVAFRPSATRQDLQSTVNCLFGRDSIMQGSFDLAGHIYGEPADRQWIDSLQGALSLTAGDGTIYSSALLTDLLRVLSLTEILVGNDPEIGPDAGLGYKSFVMKSTIQDGILLLDEVHLNGDAMEMAARGSVDLSDKTMDVTVVVAPLKTVDRVVKLIPIVNYILAGTLLSLPARVTGDIRNPKVRPLAPEAVMSGIVGIIERSVKLPVKLVEPADIPEQEPHR